jgi:hypothetical protein
MLQQPTEGSEAVPGQSSCCNLGSPVQTASGSPRASSNTVQQPSPVSEAGISDTPVHISTAVDDGDGVPSASADSDRSSNSSRSVQPPSCSTSSPVRENGPRQPRGMVRASSDGAIVNTASSFSFAMGIGAATGPAADVSCDLTLGFKEAGTPSTAAAGSGGGGGLGSGSSGNGPRPQQQQLEFFTPMRQPQLLQMEGHEDADVWETPLTSFSPRPGLSAVESSCRSSEGGVRPGEWSPSSSLTGSSISPAVAGAGWPHRRSRSSLAAVDLRPLALSPVPDESEGGVVGEDEEDVVMENSNEGFGNTGREESSGAEGGLEGLGDSCASIDMSLAYDVQDEGAAATSSAHGGGVADGISSCDSSMREALSGLTGEESLGNLFGEDSVGGGLGLGTAESGSLGEEAVVLWSGRWAGAADSLQPESSTSVPSVPEAAPGAAVGGSGAEGEAIGGPAVAAVSVPPPMAGLSPRVVPKDRYQQQHRYGKQPTPPPTLPQLQQALHHKSPRLMQQQLRHSAEWQSQLPLMQQGGAVGSTKGGAGAALVVEGPLAAAAAALPRAVAGAVRPLSAQGHHRGKAAAGGSAARCSNDSTSSSLSSTDSSCDEVGEGVVVEVKEAGLRGGGLGKGGVRSPAVIAGKEYVEEGSYQQQQQQEGLGKAAAGAQQEQGPLRVGLRGLGRLATAGGSISSSPGVRGTAGSGPQAFPLLLDDPQEVCSPVRGFRTGGSFNSLIEAQEGTAINRSLSSLPRLQRGVGGEGGHGEQQQLASSSLSSLSPLRAAIGGSPLRSSGSGGGGGGSVDGGVMRGSQRGSPMRWSQKWGTQT